MSAAPSPGQDDPGRAGRGLLTHSVGAGRHALNRVSDVRTVQHLLNMAIPGGSRLPEDGRCDARMIDRIKVFQVTSLHFASGDGRVDPGGRTLSGLLAAAARMARPPPPTPWYAGAVHAFDSAVNTVEDDWRKLESYLLRARTSPAPKSPTLTPHPTPVSQTPGVAADQIRQIMLHAGGKADEYLEVLNKAMAAHGINTPERRAAFLAQVSVESGDLNHLIENLNYSAPRLMQVWPARFPSMSVAQQYAHNPKALGNKVYAGRLGNGDEVSGDGYRYRGRGFLQITGREKYEAAGHDGDPDAVAQPTVAAETAGVFWAKHHLNDKSSSILDRSDFNKITQIVNGGQKGSQERWDAYRRALKALHCGMPN